MAVAQINNPGICNLCNKEVQYRSMSKHIQQCITSNSKNNNETSKNEIYLIKINAYTNFWLFVEINATASLEDLDVLLRETWLECCGHLSQFRMKDDYFDSDENMDIAIYKTLGVKSKFDYYYDFGSTTQLKGEVISSRPGKLKPDLRILAQNKLPEDLLCKLCNNKAQMICSACHDFSCKKCKKKHIKECEEDFMSPILNSPRMGVCGYGMEF